MSRSRAPGKGTPLAKLLKVRSLGALGVAVVAAFYIAWPLWAGYDLKSSLDEGDAARLAQRIDFPSVRMSLRPAVSKTVEDVVADQLRKAGAAGTLVSAQLKETLMPRIVDGVIATLVTPEMLIRIHASGRSLKDALDTIVLERASQTDGLGGLLVVSGTEPGQGRSRIEEVAGAFGIDTKKVLGGLGEAGAGTAETGAVTAQATTPAGPRPTYGLGNIKHVSVTGPLGLSVGVARDAKAREPDLTADMSFVNGSWKLTGLVPRL